MKREMSTPLHQPGSQYRPYRPWIHHPDLADLAPLPDPIRLSRFSRPLDPVRECSICHHQNRSSYDAACPVPHCQGILQIAKGSKASKAS